MSGQKSKGEMPTELKEAIDRLKSKFLTDYDCYNFLYQVLLESGKLDDNQCGCPTYKRVPNKAFDNNGVNGKWQKSVRPISVKYIPEYYTGGIGITSTPVAVFKRYKIPQRLPETLPYHREANAFGECSFCHSSYYITAGTFFHGGRSPILSLLTLLLIGEFYSFERDRATEIMEAFRIVNKGGDDLMGSTKTIKKWEIHAYEDKTLYKYRDKLLDPKNYSELSSYGLLHYLGF